MGRVTKQIVALLKADNGSWAVECAAMLALIIVVCIATVTSLGPNAVGTSSPDSAMTVPAGVAD